MFTHLVSSNKMASCRSKKILALLKIPIGEEKENDPGFLNHSQHISTPDESKEIYEDNASIQSQKEVLSEYLNVNEDYTIVENVQIQVIDFLQEMPSSAVDICTEYTLDGVDLTTNADEISTCITNQEQNDKTISFDIDVISRNNHDEVNNNDHDEVESIQNSPRIISESINSQNGRFSNNNIIENIEDPISDDSDQRLVPYELNSDSETSEDLPTKSKRRKKRVLVETSSWFAEKNKELREHGKKYYGRKKDGNVWNYEKPKKPRVMKPRFECKRKNETGTMKCTLITEENRRKIFEEFWNMDWGQKKVFVNMMVDIFPVERSRDRKVDTESRRGQTLKYHFKVGNEMLKVCRTLFLNTLCLGRHSVQNWLKKPIDCKKKSSQGTQQNLSNKIQGHKKRDELNLFFNSLPTMESHYCRATTTKKYLLPEWSSKKMLYDFYVKDWCAKHNVRPLSISVFHEMLDIKNIGLFAPKKDQCEKCARYRTDQLSEELYASHQEKKEEARAEKDKDKKTEKIVFTVDLQAVLMAPKSQVSSLYYRTKLQVHNLVFYNLINRNGYCYVWNEVEGGVNAEEFASIWVNLIEDKIIPNSRTDDPLKIIFYSDGCCYQNRSCTMSNALLNSAIKHKITIEQKFLEPGHTQMEADCIHSTIERALKNRNINIPAEYIEVCKGARKKPSPYDVTYLSFDFFKEFSDIQFFKSIRPGRGKGDAKVTDIRALRYTQDGEIFFKLRFSDSWQILPQRKHSNVVSLQWSQLKNLHQRRRNITARKFADLQYLKTVLPKDYHQYYDDLPHD